MESPTLVGVKDILPSIMIEKRDLMLFDQIAIPGPWLFSFIPVQAEFRADLDWLSENGLIHEISAHDAFAAQERGEPSALLRDLCDLISRMALYLVLDPELPKPRQPELLRLMHVGTEQLANTSLRVVAIHLQSVTGIRTTPLLQPLNMSDLRILPDLGSVRSLVLSFADYFNAAHPRLKELGTALFGGIGPEAKRIGPPPSNCVDRIITLLDRMETHLPENVSDHHHSNDPVLEIVLNGLPMPGESTPWEQILEFRQDPMSRDHLLALRRWMREVSQPAMKPYELRELFEENLSAFRSHMRMHRMKTHPGTVRTLITMAGDIAEHVAKREWGKAVRAFSVRERRIALLEAERSAPGRELAYVIQATDRFSKG